MPDDGATCCSSSADRTGEISTSTQIGKSGFPGFLIDDGVLENHRARFIRGAKQL